MRIHRHTSDWRQVIPVLPLIGLGFIAVAAAQGEGAVARASAPWGAIAALAVPGMLVPWWTLRQLARIPRLPLARAKPGEVAVRGLAAAIPEAPLRSPDGHDCVWYLHREGRTGSMSTPYHASDSVQPFLLEDGGHRCLVFPEGAEVSGAREPVPGSREQLIRAGEVLGVVGRLVRSSAELPSSATRALPRSLPSSLPAICVPEGDLPMLITVGDGGEAGPRLMLRLNLAVLVAAGLAFAWLRWTGR